jgi:hypothetical protein
MIVRKVLIAGVLVSAISVSLKAQITSSCDCIVDTVGLKTYLNSLNLNENASLAFEVQSQSSTFAVLHGVIDNTTPTVVQNFITNFPNVTTLVFMQMPGSEDDESNLIASQALHNRGYKHYLPGVHSYSSDAFIASGAVDMFVGGQMRVVETTGEVGVHSWSDGTNEANIYPVGHVYHQPYIDYYVGVGFSQQQAEDFYYFTINAAPANNIYLMTENEIDNYNIRTCKYASTPNFTISLQNNNCLISDTPNASYQWVDCSNGNTAIPGATNQAYCPTISGSYAVQVTINNCSGTSSCLSVNSSSLDMNELEGEFKVYPNPFTNYIHVGIDSGNTTSEFKFYSAQGQLLDVQYVLNTDGDLFVKDLESGIYFLQIKDGDSKLTYKIIKE